jgi:Fe2+ transport system protein B
MSATPEPQADAAYGPSRIRASLMAFALGKAISAPLSLLLILMLAAVMPHTEYGSYVAATAMLEIGVVLGPLGVIYNLGDVDPGEEEGATALVRRLKAATWDGTDRKVFTVPVALSLMVFFALCAQCASTLVIIGKETRSWFWPIVTFSYMTALAWLGAFAIYRIGLALGW